MTHKYNTFKPSSPQRVAVKQVNRGPVISWTIIVRFWCNIPLKKEQQNRANEKIDQPLRGRSFLNQTSMVSAH